MNRRTISHRRVKKSNALDPDDVQDRLVGTAYSQHDHGGHEHGHDWDDWLKANRGLGPKTKVNRKAAPKAVGV